MTRRNLMAAVAAVAVLALAGCGPGKLNEVKNFNLSIDKPAQAFESPAQKAAQTVKVEVSSDNAVDVYVLLGVGSQAAADMSEADLKAKAMASKTGTKAESLSVSVPAGQSVVVWVGRSGTVQNATGTVKLTN